MEADRNSLRGMGRKWTDAEEARWNAATEALDALDANAPDHDHDHQIFAEGSIAGEWADVHYRVDLDDIAIGVQVAIGAVPHGSGLDLHELSGYEAAASLSPAEARSFCARSFTPAHPAEGGATATNTTTRRRDPAH
jgi:hypothetical protein